MTASFMTRLRFRCGCARQARWWPSRSRCSSLVSLATVTQTRAGQQSTGCHSQWPQAQASLEGAGGDVGLSDVAGGTVVGHELPQRGSDLVALFDSERAPPAEPAARCRVDHLGRFTPV